MAWLTDVLERIVSGRTKANELHTLLPWNWRRPTSRRRSGRGCMIDNPEPGRAPARQAASGAAAPRSRDARTCSDAEDGRTPRPRYRRPARSPGSATPAMRVGSCAGSTSRKNSKPQPSLRSPTCASTPACRSRATSPPTRSTASNASAPANDSDASLSTVQQNPACLRREHFTDYRVRHLIQSRAVAMAMPAAKDTAVLS